MTSFDPGPFMIPVKNATSSSQTKTEKLTQLRNEFDDLVGLGNVKVQLNQLMAYARLMTIRRQRDLPVGPINLHMVFAGPPGTGKTEVARKVGRMLHAIGLLRSGRCVEVDKSQLVASYVGQTAPLVVAKVKEALDGVLFIDEAYTLAGISPGQTQAKPGQFEQEAIDTLLKQMEDNRDRLVVIAAGYTNEMRVFLDSNTGLKSRFARWIDFDTYSRDELYEIFSGMVLRDKYTLGSDAEREARQHIQFLHRPNDPSFGNAREVRGFYEKVQMAQAQRLAMLPDLESLPNEAFMSFTGEDIRAAAQS